MAPAAAFVAFSILVSVIGVTDIRVVNDVVQCPEKAPNIKNLLRHYANRVFKDGR